MAATAAKKQSSKGRVFIGLDEELPPGYANLITNDPIKEPLLSKNDDPNRCHSLMHDRNAIRVNLPEKHANEDGTPAEGWEIIEITDLPAEYFHRGGKPKQPVSRQERAKQIARLIKRDRQWFTVGYDDKGNLGELDSGKTLDEVLSGGAE